MSKINLGSDVLQAKVTTAFKNTSEVDLSKFVKFDVYADLSRADLTWSKYGTMTAPIVVRDRFGKPTSKSKLKAWFIQDPAIKQKKDQNKYDFKKFLPNGLAVLPMEEVQARLETVMADKLKDLTLSFQSTHTANDGDTKYWNIVSDEVFKVDDGDEVKLGVTVRNGIGTYVALGVDLYTYRLICKNGAVAKGKNLGSFALPHVGDPKRIERIFTDGIIVAFSQVKKILEYYRRSTVINVNSEIANKMYAKLSALGETYLPPSWDIPSYQDLQKLKKKGLQDELEKNKKLVKVTKKESLWDVFNHVTATQRERLQKEKVTYSTVVLHQSKLHGSLMEIVNQYGPKGGRKS